jgi:uncharacterized repeat protein (TIGR03847 family)
VVIEAQEITEDDEAEAEEGQEVPAAPEAEVPAADDRPEPAVLRVRISPGVARAFTQRALEIVAAGRPPCPLCGQPLDADGHICVRLNGHRGQETL